ncbi:Hsp70 family protein [Glycomyces buryatensis]|uniref:Hsp70 family protein n=1 Tax=Glycomyces buryatensis TaxID=2570927 RepID=A0A4S8QGP7_9ACTN|nr:Hsp70 family protein [Glycomyces buryatensis]THV39834.1 Hsp70 family protein [Glycomyces buryatensis]
MTAIGIDLGTTNSVVARRDGAREGAAVVKVHGKSGTPSVVGLRRRDGKDEFLVGANALNFAKRDPQHTIQSVKRLMGRDFADPAVEQARGRRAYQITTGPGGDPRAHVVMGDTTYSPVEVSTMILRHLRDGAQEKLGEDVTAAVITVPAYFQEAQRTATREAGEAAGMVVKRIIDEPTAAAIAFGLEWDKGERRRVLVYDLGGGTFDISILNTTQDAEGQNHFQVLDFVGDNWLGGDDFDLLIVDKIIDWVKRESGTDPAGDTKFLFLAKEAAEEAKRELTESDSADIIIPAAFRTAGGVGDVEMTLSKDEFDAMIEPLVDKTLGLVRQALERQSLSTGDVSDVLLVGGSTLVPKVAASVERMFGPGKVRKHIDPMECVAIGAGILADTLRGVECAACQAVNDESDLVCSQCGESLTNARSAGDTHVYDVTGMALGVAAVKGSNADAFVPIIPRGTPYPLAESMHEAFSTTDGRKILVPVYEGDSPVASENHEQGVIDWELPEEVDANTRVDVAFLFDRNRELHVKISVPGTPFEKDLTLKVDAARTKAPAKTEVDEDDIAYREDLIVTVEAARHFVRVYEQYLDPSQAMKIESDLNRAEQTLMLSDPEECRRMTDVLNRDIFGAGLATQLYLAERAASQASPEDAQRINHSVASLQKAHLEGRTGTVQQQSQALNAMLAKVRQESASLREVEDAENFDGMLRRLEES